MGDKHLRLSELNLEGQFLGFTDIKSGKAKYLQLAIPTGNLYIKLPKELRSPLQCSLIPGEQIRVCGVSKVNTRTGEIKIKAHQITSIDVCPNQELSPQPQAKIMVCQKSGCVKRGGKSLLSELEKTLCDRGLRDKVEIEHTGCQKRCSSAPNCVLMLGKKKYKKLHPEAIASLLENHLT
ncbi:(2Fe-2S) ferredoxin domain-containing protein [Nostoc sp. FACHB-152]|uniref:(2Fe-2S) ferredoxin domain-containing protein n=1 Tax=unclassified Nostoc TaxID=2593658 RepID=UPI001688EC61|nr:MULTISPECIES: (2Fe-2S) ferredoxin domain-containing protein [unclassified Nostoc]MBD2450847.1 (2Fe-2S) ferredoxin domain-containing protein [Nostoc sp. FACHB-152]MBD2473238.1 (2Fe-2S) ferredoxin domain-containing protein [Nostoc sp. FACHB-145]